MNRSLVLALAVPGMLASCSAPGPAAGKTPLPREEKVELTMADVAQSPVPVLRSSYLEENWGKPAIGRLEDGGWRLTYRQGTTLNFVTIYSMTSSDPAPATPPTWQEASGDPFGPAAPIHAQKWRTATIVGKKVKWYKSDDGGGADFPSYKTVDFSAASPKGGRGHYRIQISTDVERKAADWFTRLNW